MLGAGNRPRDWLRLACTAFTFLTRIPAYPWASHEQNALADSTPFFPIVGSVIGAMGGAVFYVVRMGFGSLTAAYMGIGVTAIVTGCFHEDAFADVCDGFGASDAKRRLEIMRDSRLGSFGVVGTVLLIGCKASVLASMPVSLAVLSFIAAHAICRWSSVLLLFISTATADAGSLAKPLVVGMKPIHVLTATVFAILSAAWVPWPVIVALFLVIGFLCLVGDRFFRSWIGGISGDAVGAVNQLCELAVYMVLFKLDRFPLF